MAQTVRDVMTANPRIVDANDAILEAARAMRDDDVGALVVVANGQAEGILTDRDIVVRGVADERQPDETTVGEIATRNLVALNATDTVEQAAALMREHAVRRLPVVENGQTVGIVSLGDLAIERDSQSALAEISAAPANN
jgi:CBS domain-containing protein